ncbi:MAG: B12-binding domain-containing radical SAM protein [Chloroflexi bacterium HGW-Chloroflexi-1]|nr:MAG: B12-binding domain-containing radical SAM protein [Chloroflexi bacterium HGW-Chloroflexi-1]
MQISHYLLDRILPTVTMPARYTGGEWNSIVKDWDAAQVRLVLAYPDVYQVGMSNLGLMILYDIVNRRPDCLAERVYAPWVDMEAAMRQAGIPLYSLESRHPLREFDVLGFTLPYELNFSNVLNMLDLAGLPVLAAERGADWPLVIGGGVGAVNAEPLADFFDAFAIGDGEEVILEILNACARAKESRAGKLELLRALAGIPGVYVPSLYQVTYHDDGTVAAITPTTPEARPRILRRVMSQLLPPPVDLIVPYVQAVHDRGMVEIARGCTAGCRFCQAGMVYRPLRERSLPEVLAAVEAIGRCTGYEEIALVSLSSASHPQIEEMVRELIARYSHPPLAVSLPSLRIDTFSVRLAELFQGRRKTGLTFAPEAGSQRLRDVINKRVTEADLLATAEAAFAGGWQRIKLYFMIGLPTETLDDVAAIVELVQEVRAVGRRYHGRRAQVNVSVATFIPKPHTPFQWSPLVGEDDLATRLALLRRGVKGRGVQLSWHAPQTSLLEAALARGDRRLGRVIHRAWQLGARFDAWPEHFGWEVWQRAFAAEGLDADWYARRERSFAEVLPWDHIENGVSKAFLWDEYRRALHGETTPDCREMCVGCGLAETLGCEGAG